MRKLFLIIALSIFVFANEDMMEDEFLDEFSDELKVEKKSDPLESYNRIMTGINDAAYENVFYPVSKGYKKVVHKELRKSVGNFFYNILYPQRVLNNLLQGKFKNSLEETGYFLVNSTLGILGLFDVAKEQFGMESHNEDFGQTLGSWGVGSGFHIVIPFFGPSNLRDFAGIIPDGYVNCMNYTSHRNYNMVDDSKDSIYIKLFERVNYTSLNLENYHNLKKDAVDLYPYLRDSYEQYREKQIKE